MGPTPVRGEDAPFPRHAVEMRETAESTGLGQVALFRDGRRNAVRVRQTLLMHTSRHRQPRSGWALAPERVLPVNYRVENGAREDQWTILMRSRDHVVSHLEGWVQLRPRRPEAAEVGGDINTLSLHLQGFQLS